MGNTITCYIIYMVACNCLEIINTLVGTGPNVDILGNYFSQFPFSKLPFSFKFLFLR